MMENKGEAGGKRAPSPSQASAGDDPPRHISARILDSASGLLRGSFSPNSTQQANTLAQALASEGKAGPGSSSSSNDRGTASELHRGPQAGQALDSLPGANNAFREPGLMNGSIHTRSGDASGGMSLDQFMHGAQHENEVPIWQQDPTAKGKQTAPSADNYHTDLHQSEAEMSAVWDSIALNEHDQEIPASNFVEAHGPNEVHRAAVISAVDGADVVKLLRDPNFSVGMDMPEEQDIVCTISGEDMKIAAEIVRRIDVAMISKPGYQSAMSAVNRGEPFPRFSSFFDEIENYQDEVWGYLRPLVEEAKRETAASSLLEGEEGPATRRLRMILAHIDRPG
jgi:hypothetical protein